MGWLDAVGSAFKWFAGEGIAQSLVRVAVGVGLMRYLNKSTQNGQDTNSSSTPQGVRQQIAPATDNKLPVAYGDSYFSGTIIDVQLTNENKEMYAVIALCEQTGDIFSTSPSAPANRSNSSITIDDVYLNNQRITFKSNGTTIDYTTDDTGVQDTNARDLVGIYLYQGNSSSPMLPCQTGTTTPIPGTLPPAAYSIMPGWSTSHVAQNIIFAVVKMNYDPSKGVHNVPALKFHVRNTLNKPGDVLHDYMTNELYGGGVDESLIDPDGIIALNTYSDEMVTYPGFPAQKRYVINGLIRTTESVMSNLDRIASAAGSNITYDISTGKWSTVISKVTVKTADFDDNNIIGQIAVNGTALDNYYNSVEVQFPYSVLRDQMNFARIDLPVALRNANESDNMLQITHELVNNIVQASVLGNLELRQSREDISVVFDTDYSKFNVQVGAVIGITNAGYGWSDKEFRVIRVRKNESDDGRLTLEITALAYNADVYTVENIDDFTPSIGPGYSIPSLGPISKPNAPTVDTGTTISSQPSITLSAVVPTGIVTEMEFWFTADTNPNDSLRNYTLLGSTREENSGPFTIGSATSFKTVLLRTGTYHFKVRATNQYGSSLYSDPSAGTNYIYTQAPDVLPYTVPSVDENGQALMDGSDALNMGAIAFYVASKLNWGDILSGNVESWSDLFGISSNVAADVSAAVSSEATSNIVVGTTAISNVGISATSFTSNVGNTIVNTTTLESDFAISMSANALAKGYTVDNLGGGHWQINFNGGTECPPSSTEWMDAGSMVGDPYCSGINLVVDVVNVPSPNNDNTVTQIIQANCAACPGGVILPPTLDHVELEFFTYGSNLPFKIDAITGITPNVNPTSGSLTGKMNVIMSPYVVGSAYFDANNVYASPSPFGTKYVSETINPNGDSTFWVRARAFWSNGFVSYVSSEHFDTTFRTNAASYTDTVNLSVAPPDILNPFVNTQLPTPGPGNLSYGPGNMYYWTDRVGSTFKPDAAWNVPDEPWG